MPLNRRTIILSLGYLKLVLINLLQLGFQIRFLYALFMESDYGIPSLSFLAEVAILIVDTAFCVVLLVGGHKRSRSVLRVYFWLAIVGVVMATLRCAYALRNFAITHNTSRDILHNPIDYAMLFWFHFVAIAIQITLLVIVRREIRSLSTVH